jgi:signal transduction histidine kinase
MKNPFARMPLGWRIFVATSITVTILFAAAGWGLQQYAISVADDNVRAEIQASIQAYEAVWKARTEVLSKTSALMAGMSDVRSAFSTRDPKTIRDSAQELWSRVSDSSAIFLVLDAEGHLISSLGKDSNDLPVSAIPLRQAEWQFPRQLAGYIRNNDKLFYVVLTPVYVQTSTDPILLDVLCAGLRIDRLVASQLKQLGPRSDFAFLGHDAIFASTLDNATARLLSQTAFSPQMPGAERFRQKGFIVSQQPLKDILGQPVAELCIVRSYANELQSLSRLRRSLGLAWILTVAIALLVSSYATTQLLRPIKLLDRAAAEVASGNYLYRVPVKGSNELSRLATTFNQMCQSIEQAQDDLIRHEQIHTIGRLGSSLVHDLRNPLAAIYGGAELLVDGQLPPEHTRRIAANIHRACERVQELLRDLVNVSRGQGQDLDFYCLREMVEAAVESVDSEGTQVRLSIEIDETLEVFGERTRIERVFTNLLSNAVEAMPGGGEISIQSCQTETGINVFVEDTGPGIPPDMHMDVFRPFVTGKRSGLGLGLALSRQTMMDTGGRLISMTPRRGSGACFCVYFAKTRSTKPSLV